MICSETIMETDDLSLGLSAVESALPPSKESVRSGLALSSIHFSFRAAPLIDLHCSPFHIHPRLSHEANRTPGSSRSSIATRSFSLHVYTFIICSKRAEKCLLVIIYSVQKDSKM